MLQLLRDLYWKIYKWNTFCTLSTRRLTFYKHSDMKKNHTIIILVVLLISCFDSCKKADKVPSTDKQVIIDDSTFNSYPNDQLIITEAKIIGDSLQIKFGASCCDGKTWITKLVGSQQVLYSDPPQRSIRLSLKNYEICLAACATKVTFDLKPFRVNGGKIVLNLNGWSGQLLYIY